MNLEFTKCEDTGYHVLKISAEEDFVRRVYDYVTGEVDRLAVKYSHLVCCPDLPLEPEGDDRLDGMHPHWSEPGPHTWLRVLPLVKMLGEIRRTASS